MKGGDKLYSEMLDQQKQTQFMSTREEMVIIGRHQGFSRRELAGLYIVTEHRIRQIEARAIRKYKSTIPSI